MILKGLDKNGNIRRIETKSKGEWQEFKPLNQYYIDGEQVTKEEAERLLEEIKNADPNFQTPY